MIDGIREYVLSIIAASIICSVIKSTVGTKTGYGKVTSLICGVFLACTFLSPLIDFEIYDWTVFPVNIKTDAQDIASQAFDESRSQLRTIITEETEAYILEKAASIGADIHVEVLLHDEEPIPVGVVINGNIAPYNKTVLSQYMADTLAITEDAQIWNLDQ